jgi:hypothetical protein
MLTFYEWILNQGCTKAPFFLRLLKLNQAIRDTYNRLVYLREEANTSKFPPNKELYREIDINEAIMALLLEENKCPCDELEKHPEYISLVEKYDEYERMHKNAIIKMEEAKIVEELRMGNQDPEIPEKLILSYQECCCDFDETCWYCDAEQILERIVSRVDDQ